MGETIREGVGLVEPGLAFQLTGRGFSQGTLLQVSGELMPSRSRERDLAVQAVEIYNIRRTADRIEELFRKKGLPLPSVYALHTAGFSLPFAGETLGRYTDSAPFELFPPTDIVGHEGSVNVAKIDDNHTYLAFLGREHTYEGWLKHPYGQIIAARKLRVIKELARRQRENGENPVIITTYLSGVAAGHPLKPGDIGIIVSDTELGSSTHPGTGPHGVFDTWLGDRFQPKWGRSSNKDLARAFYQMAHSGNTPAGPVALVGTFDDPAFEDPMDAGIALAGFEIARKIGLDALAREIIPQRNAADWTREIFRWRQRTPSLVWGMGVSAEMGTPREVITRINPRNDKEKVREVDFPVLALTLITDTVGGEESVTTTHGDNVANALATEPRNTRLLGDFVSALVSGKVALPKYTHPTLPDWAAPFSLQGATWHEAERQESEAEENILAGFDVTPLTYLDLQDRFYRQIMLEKQLVEIYRTWLYPDVAVLHIKEINKYNQLSASLARNSDGQAAYAYYIEMRDVHLNAAAGRLKRMAFLAQAPPESRHVLNPEFQEKKRQWHLQKARFFEQSAKIVAEAKNISHEAFEIN